MKFTGAAPPPPNVGTLNAVAVVGGTAEATARGTAFGATDAIDFKTKGLEPALFALSGAFVDLLMTLSTGCCGVALGALRLANGFDDPLVIACCACGAFKELKGLAGAEAFKEAKGLVGAEAFLEDCASEIFAEANGLRAGAADF